jgi:hypothetical protein
MIYAYPNRPSVLPGPKSLKLHVSTDAPQFRVDFYRQGKSFDFLLSSGWLTGFNFPSGSPDSDWGWPGYEFDIPSNWKSGAYVAILVEGDGSGNGRTQPSIRPDGRSAKALFVLLSPNPGANRILYKLSLATYHAYNFTGGGAFYYVGVPSTDPALPGNKVTMLRPGGGTGGIYPPWPWLPGDVNAPDPPYVEDPYDSNSPRPSFAHWDVPFIGWLESNGYQVDYCTDLDIHEDPDLLSSYCLLLSVGHDEYWSQGMRQHIEAFVGNGGNVAFFSGNTCWWLITFTDGNTAFVQGTNWQNFNPEDSLTGVSYGHAGGWWNGTRDALGYAVQHSGHWVFDGTGVADGQVFGEADSLVGYECDGSLHEDASGIEVALHTKGTPNSFVILGFAALGPGWGSGGERREGDESAATMGMYTRNGTVFTAATVDWPRVLAAGEPVVDRITRNVLDRLRCKSVHIKGPHPGVCGMLAAVENTTAHFFADISNLPMGETLHYQWRISSQAAPLPDDSPAVNILIPAGPKPVTVTVRVSNAVGPIAYGTLTFTPVTQELAKWAEYWCRLLNWVRTAARHRKAVSGVREGNEIFVDPLFDPLRGQVIHPRQWEGLRIAAQDLHSLVQAQQQLLEVTHELEELQKHQRK